MKTFAKLAAGAAAFAFTAGAHAQSALDLNRATEAQLSQLICKRAYTDQRKRPNVSYCNSEAKKIVRGRLYRAVAELQARKIISKTLFNVLKSVVAVSAAPTPTPPTPTPPAEPALPFPTSIDLTAKMSAVKDQGRRGTCIAFSTTGSMEAFDKTLDLSEQHAFWQMREKGGYKNTCLTVKYDEANPKLCQDRGCYGTNLQTAVSVLQGTGLVGERDWLYESMDNKAPGTNCHESITWASKLPAGLSSKKTVKMGRVTWLASPGGYPKEKRVDDPMVLMAVLAQGLPVTISIGVAGAGWRDGLNIDIELDPTTKKPVAIRGGHGLVLVGYDYAKKVFKFKNSWSSTWGQSGYGYMTFDYLKHYITGGYYAAGIVK